MKNKTLFWFNISRSNITIIDQLDGIMIRDSCHMSNNAYINYLPGVPVSVSRPWWSGDVSVSGSSCSDIIVSFRESCITHSFVIQSRQSLCACAMMTINKEKKKKSNSKFSIRRYEPCSKKICFLALINFVIGRSNVYFRK